MPRTTAPAHFPAIREESSHAIADLLLAGWEDAADPSDTGLRMDLPGSFGDWVLYIDRRYLADRETEHRFTLYIPGCDEATLATSTWDALAPYVGCDPDGAPSVLPAAFRKAHADYSAACIDGDARRCREARQQMAALSAIMDRWNATER